MKEKLKKESFKTLLRNMLNEWKWLLRYIKKYRWSVLLYCLIGAIGTAMGLGTGVASKYLIDAIVSYNSNELITAALLMIGLTVFQIILTAVTSGISSLVGSKIHMKIRGDFFERMILADWEEINSYHSGDLINRLEGDVTTVSSSVISFIPNVLTRSLQFFGALGIVLYYDKTMALLALIGAPVIVLTSRFMIKRIRAFNKKSREMNSEILIFGEESLQNMQTVKSFGLTRQYISNFKKLLQSYRSVKLNFDKFSILMTMCLSFIGIVVSYSCYGWGVWRLWHGAITYGTMTLFLQLSGTLTSSFSALISLAPTAVSIATSAGRIMELTELKSEVDEQSEIVADMLKQAKTSGIRLLSDKISFSYKDGHIPILSNSDFYAEPGEIIAIIGPSGEGKSTILRILLGLLHPQSGSVKVEVPFGQCVEVSASTRRLFSYVPQGKSLFSGTVEDNLRLGKADATEEEMIQALKIAGAWDFVSQIPEGLQANVGENGMNFSEGQGQRLAIARAVLRDAPIMLLDEATSALDADTEQLVLDGIIKNDPLKVCILTTHRLGVLKRCNRIYRVSCDGKIQQVSQREVSELMER